MAEYRQINNLSSSNNHSTRLKKLFEESEDVIIASPFLMTDFSDFFGELDLSMLNKIHLITTLSPKSYDQIKKISSLTSFIEFPAIKEKKVNCQISLNNKLHGKIYIFKMQRSYISAIISSANFTGSGLVRNHEWGIEISNNEEIKELEESILQSIEFPNLTFDEIYRMQQATTTFLEQQPEAEIREIELNLTSLISTQSFANQFDETINFWLKPIGVSDNPVAEDRLFNEANDHLHFSKQRPNGVKPNDILIAYAVGTTKILSIYRVTSFPIHVTQEEMDDEGDNWIKRWPWYVIAENLTVNFGATWPNHNLYKNELLEEFLTLHPSEPITSVGGKTLGALNFGKDKLKLSPNFARFIMDKVFTINNR